MINQIFYKYNYSKKKDPSFLVDLISVEEGSLWFVTVWLVSLNVACVGKLSKRKVKGIFSSTFISTIFEHEPASHLLLLFCITTEGWRSCNSL